MGQLLDGLLAMEESSTEVEVADFTVDFIREAEPTPNKSLPRKLIKFKELPRAIFILSNALQGVVKPGSKVKATIKQNDEYFNVIAVEGADYIDVEFSPKRVLQVQA